MKNRILWSEYELDIVKKYYPIGGVRACLNFINRSKQTIRKKARDFKIQMDGHSKFFYEL